MLPACLALSLIGQGARDVVGRSLGSERARRKGFGWSSPPLLVSLRKFSSEKEDKTTK